MSQGLHARGLEAGSQGLSGGTKGRSTGYRAGKGRRFPGPVARVPSPEPPVTAPAPRGCVSAHGQSGSSVAASPVRASPAGLSRRPAYAGARARRHRLRGTCWVLRRPPAPPPRPDRRARPPEPTWHDCHLRSHRPGVKQCGERETPRSQPREQRGGSEHRARARRRRRSLGARARGGGGAHVRVFVSGSRRTRGLLAAGGGHFLWHPGLRPKLASMALTRLSSLASLSPSSSCPSTALPTQTHCQEK